MVVLSGSTLSSSEDGGIAAQKRAFTSWVNVQLAESGCVSDLQKDFEDGVVLIKLLESLAVGKKMPGRCVVIVTICCMHLYIYIFIYITSQDAAKIVGVNSVMS